MSTFKNDQEILDFAIQNEQEAADFYRSLTAKTSNPIMKKNLKSFAEEEDSHKNALSAVKEGTRRLSQKKVQDLKIADYVVDMDPEATTNYRQALMLAMKREKAAYRLYSSLAEITEDPALRETFLGLALEEANHKLRFETEYDEEIMKEN